MAACLPLPGTQYQALDAQTAERPEEAAHAALQLLQPSGAPPNVLAQAQLYAVLADARGEQSQLAPALAAIDAEEARLQSLTASPETLRLRVRLVAARATLWIASGNSTGALAEIDRVVRTLAPSLTLEYACALAGRALAYEFLGETDRSVADALTAYRLADAHGWQSARLDSAYILSTELRRAGLYERAEEMLDVAAELARAQGQTALLSTVEYGKGQLMLAWGRFDEARAALQRSRGYAAQLHDRFGVATADASLCGTLVAAGNLDAADAICAGGDADIAAGDRRDLAAMLQLYRAELDLARGRAGAALVRLDDALTLDLHAHLPTWESQAYRDRARAYTALKRYEAANADLRSADELDRTADLGRRRLQVGVLMATYQADQLTAANQLLEERVGHAQSELASQRQERRLWATLAVAAALLCAMLGYVIFMVRRHHRKLRRQGIILQSSASRAPDALLLLDERRRVRFANRHLCGLGPAHAVGEPLNASVPASLLPLLNNAIDEAFATHAPVSFWTRVADGPRTRQYEIWILPAFDGDSPLGVTVRSSDITDARALERGVIDDAASERSRLSADLHEGLCQQLAGVLLMLGNLTNVIRRGRPGAPELIGEISNYVQNGIDTARELARGLAPVKVGRGSLSVALQWLVADAAKRLRIVLSTDICLDGVLLADAVADHLFRLCREALNDAGRRTGCSRVHIKMHIEGSMLCVKISGDGVVIEAEPEGFGMKIMAYRAKLLGGALRSAQGPGGGILITVSLPLSQVDLAPRVA